MLMFLAPSLAVQGVASPGRNIALALCSDGVVPTKKGGRGYWPVALQCLNLPPWLRTKMPAMMLCCVMANTTDSISRHAADIRDSGGRAELTV